MSEGHEARAPQARQAGQVQAGEASEGDRLQAASVHRLEPETGPARSKARRFARLYAGAVSETKFVLDESALPTRWYNIARRHAEPAAAGAASGDGQPVGPDDLAPLFPMELILQEVSEEPEIAIPDEVLDIYRLWRPTPLYRAHRLERAVGTRSRIFYKYEGVSPAGSHKPNTAVAQAYYNKAEGRTRLATETGAGQWGSALAFACKLIGLECKVYMVRVSYEQKPFRRSLMQTWGATVVAARPTRPNAAARSSRSIPTRPAASASRSRKRSRTRPGATTRRTRSAACSTTCCCTRR